MIPYNRELIQPAKELRRHMTKEEKCLWQRVQLNHLGYKFYRQKPIGDYIVDFFCPKAQLVVEVDGGHHFTEIGKGNDRLRNEHMKSLKLNVLRFTNSEVLNNTDKVVETIRTILLHPPFRKGDNPGVYSK
jgi:very-short-patch-repair endonuclease